jgi:hypothetical protein
MQWTVDPRRISGDVAEKALAVFEAGLVTRTSRNAGTVPSWSVRDRRYAAVISRTPEGWKVVCECDAKVWCHHGYALVLQICADEHVEIPVPSSAPAPARRRRRRDRGQTFQPRRSA